MGAQKAERFGDAFLALIRAVGQEMGGQEVGP